MNTKIYKKKYLIFGIILCIIIFLINIVLIKDFIDLFFK